MGILKEKEKSLFESIKEDLKRKGITKIVSDGVVSEDTWELVKIRCLFLLKEAMGENDDFSLTDFLAKGARYKGDKTWCNVARWIYCIFKQLENPSFPIHIDYYDDVRKVGLTPNGRKEWLKYIAAVNVKKEPGKSKTNTKILKEQFKQYYAKWIPKQLKMYEGINLIVCCGAGVKECLIDVFEETFAEKYNFKNWKVFEYPGNYTARILYYELKNGTVIVDFWHPAARTSNEKKNNVFTRLVYETVIKKK
ncbi:hypothetical protein CTM63_05910 [Prevotella intermedia]|jgi:hypothetical protein|uniref:hypothetical protein n=1 Tax=Prevotella intermedia TaxID=28131 RepID=UPI000C1BCDAA|nr:hypothetical protein [Prevotella intermedia]ATV28704.1 hypothetical protein CTM63_05910 [Prevotella intermedia]